MIHAITVSAPTTSPAATRRQPVRRPPPLSRTRTDGTRRRARHRRTGRTARPAPPVSSEAPLPRPAVASLRRARSGGGSDPLTSPPWATMDLLLRDYYEQVCPDGPITPKRQLINFMRHSHPSAPGIAALSSTATFSSRQLVERGTRAPTPSNSASNSRNRSSARGHRGRQAGRHLDGPPCGDPLQADRGRTRYLLQAHGSPWRGTQGTSLRPRRRHDCDGHRPTDETARWPSLHHGLREVVAWSKHRRLPATYSCDRDSMWPTTACGLSSRAEREDQTGGQFHSSSYLSSGAVGDGKGVTGSPHIGHWI
jgi:hypothetical protein